LHVPPNETRLILLAFFRALPAFAAVIDGRTLKAASIAVTRLATDR
jgi:hypothetical protein